MLTVNSISGGKSSAFLAKHYPADYELFSLVCIDDVKCAPKDKSIVQFVNDKLQKVQLGGGIQGFYRNGRG
jgi:diphthamide synthase (EF-2-diphthine--ammonia ligase)